MKLPPLSLYVHIPWCIRKCPYCDFNSHEAESIPEAAYTAALLRDLHREQRHSGGRRLISIFFGGGTPSLFSAASIGEVLRCAESTVGFAPDIEITLEANPGATEYGNLRALRDTGVNRLSFGIQSFHDDALRALGRIHSSDQARQAVAAARTAGFDNLNLDLMHGLPGQTEAQALADLHQAMDLAPEHISWYQLTIEPNTVFHSRPPQLPDDSALEAIQSAGEEALRAGGYQQYEISAWSRPDRQARHNLNYWGFGDYLAIGAGAHGKITHAPGHIDRYNKTRMPSTYLDPDALELMRVNRLEGDQLPVEFMLNALRLVEGVPADWFPARTGVALEKITPQLDALRRRGLLVTDPERIATTPLGMRYLNDVLQEFMV